MTDIGRWLDQLGLARYAGAFAAAEIDLSVLPELSEADLEKLGIPLGPRKKLLRAIAGLAATPDSPSPKPNPAAERRQLTVMFADLADSTALSRALDPEELREVMRGYQAAVTTAIREAGGFVAKYLGDGVLAYFGYPQAQEDAAERAVQAGLAAVGAVKALPPVKGVALAARVSIATGPVVVGDVIGEDIAREVNVVGEVPNLAARLLALGEPGCVVIEESTRRLIGDLFRLESLGARELKGVTEPITSFAVREERQGMSRFESAHAARQTRFVGRSQEVGLLQDRWEHAKAGEGQLVLLSGEAGIGKSRITETFHEHIAGEPHVRIFYQCSSQHLNSPLYPAASQLARAAGIAPDDDAQAKTAKLRTVLAEPDDQQLTLLGSLLGVPLLQDSVLAQMAPQLRRQRLLEALAYELEALSRHQPVLWLVEDAHWIDPTTQDLVSMLVDRVPRLKVLIIITFRPEYRAPWSADSTATQVALNRLTPTQISTLLESLAGGRTLPAEVIEHFVAKSDGIPLYVEEIFKSLCDGGVLVANDHTFILARPFDGDAVPATLQDALTARLDKLAPAKVIAQMGAAIGREFDHRLLAEIAGGDPDILRQGLDGLVAAGLIFARGTPPDASYSFKHALVQNSAYRSLLKGQRQAVHHRIAKALSHAPGRTSSEVIARHFERAGEIHQAMDWWERAGDSASEVSANREAIARYSAALSLHDKIPTETRSHRQISGICQKLASVVLQSEGFGSKLAKELFERSQRIADEAQDLESYVRASVGLWGMLYRGGNCRISLEGFEGLSEADLSKVSPYTRCQYTYSRGVARYLVGQLAAANDDFSVAVMTADGLPQEQTKSFYLIDPAIAGRSYGSATLFPLGWPSRAWQVAQEGLRVARIRDHAFLVASAVYSVGRTALWLGWFSEAESALAEAVSISKRHGFAARSAVALLHQGINKINLGNIDEGTTEVDRGVDQWRKITGPFHLSCFLSEAAHACVSQSEIDLAARYIQDASAVVRQFNEGSHAAELLRLSGVISAARGQMVRAIDELSEAIAVAEGQQANGFKLRAARDLARIHLSAGRRDEARAVLAPVFAWFTEGFDTRDLKEAKALLEEIGA